MLPQNKFIKLINDIITSRYFSLVMTLIGFSMTLGLFVNPVLGFIAFATIIIVMLLFIFMIYVITNRTENGYIIENITHNWRMNDSEGNKGRGEKEFRIKLTRALKSIRESIHWHENLVHYQGFNILSIYEDKDATQKIAIINFDALYPAKTELYFKLILSRDINDGNNRYIGIPVTSDTRNMEATIRVPLPKGKFANSLEFDVELLQRKLGTTKKLDTNSKDILGRITHSLEKDASDNGKVKR